ncbi:lysoplasmalogenase TMEM86B isoform X2 [Erinaceus europaeus]|uniref:Lysoplasmalogenase TMEM86B n=1 Tax=Erinaceus europaeus TaxID=9365 RepID=A0A1S3WRK5_ERIEU|nr:lysoplasmalogenase TMEM86B isoform X2 [Erinaceus europaeus]
MPLYQQCQGCWHQTSHPGVSEASMGSWGEGQRPKPDFRLEVREPWKRWLHVGKWLSPFFVTCAVYFLLWIPEDPPSWLGALVKCLPVLCLALYLRARGSPSLPRAALLCSAVGDACLIWPQAFFYGMAAFASAHLLYLWALGWAPLRPRLLLPVVLVCIPYSVILLLHLPPDLALPFSGYTLVLSLVLWRGLVRGPPASWGALFFTLSDSVLAWHMFVRPLPHGRLVVMTTYYAAQLLLALSAVPRSRHKSP